jgi:hypothetical protein
VGHGRQDHHVSGETHDVGLTEPRLGSGGLVVMGIFGIFRDFVLLCLFSLWFFAIDEVSNMYWVF